MVGSSWLQLQPYLHVHKTVENIPAAVVFHNPYGFLGSRPAWLKRPGRAPQRVKNVSRVLPRNCLGCATARPGGECKIYFTSTYCTHQRCYIIPYIVFDEVAKVCCHRRFSKSLAPEKMSSLPDLVERPLQSSSRAWVQHKHGHLPRSFHTIRSAPPVKTYLHTRATRTPSTFHPTSTQAHRKLHYSAAAEMGYTPSSPTRSNPNRRCSSRYIPPTCPGSRHKTTRLTAEEDRSAGRPRGADCLNGGVQVKLPHTLQPQPGAGRRLERPLHELSALRDRPRRCPPREREAPALCVAKYLPRNRQALSEP